MVKMVESAEEFKTLKMGDKPVRASPPRAPPGSFLRVVIKSAVRAFYGPSTHPPYPFESSVSAKTHRDATERATSSSPIHRARSPALEIHPQPSGSPRGPLLFFK